MSAQDTENQENSQAVVSNVQQHRPWLLPAIVAACLVVVSAGFIYFFAIRSSNKAIDTSNANTVVCSNETISAASKAIDANDSLSLGSVAAKVVKLKDYTNDINCLYIAARYNIMITNTSEAQKYIKLLDKKAPLPSYYSKYFTTRPLTIQQMEQTVSVIEQQAKEVESVQDSNDKLDAAGTGQGL